MVVIPPGGCFTGALALAVPEPSAGYDSGLIINAQMLMGTAAGLPVQDPDLPGELRPGPAGSGPAC